MIADLTYRSLESDQEFNFHNSVAEIAELLSKAVDISLITAKQIQEVYKKRLENTDETFRSKNSEMKISSSIYGENIKQRFLFTHEGLNIRLDFDKGNEYGDGLLHLELTEEHSRAKDFAEIIRKNILSKTEFVRSEKFGVLTEVELAVLKSEYTSEERLTLDDVVIPIDQQEEINKPASLKSKLRFDLVFKSSYDAIQVRFTNNQVYKLDFKDLPNAKAFTLDETLGKSFIFSNEKFILAHGVITVDDVLEHGKELQGWAKTSFSIQLGYIDYRESKNEDSGYFFGLRPFEEEKIIDVGGWRGSGHSGAGGSQNYSWKDLQSYSEPKSRIRECGGNWLLELIEKSTSNKEFIEAVFEWYYDNMGTRMLKLD